MDLKYFEGIPNSIDWVNLEVLSKGYSGDKKYKVVDKDSNKFLLRISNVSTYESRKKQYDLLCKIDTLNVNAPKPISFGKVNEEEIYMLLSWVEGEDADIIVGNLSNKEAYYLGVEAGEILSKLHKLPVDTNEEKSWGEKYRAKIQRKYKAMEECSLDIPHKELLIKYMNEHIHLLDNREQTFTHGDYHLSNLIIDGGKIGVIDFEKNKVSDPYDDLKPFMWNVFVSEYFQTGLINGYFDNNIPEDFFPILAVYAVENMISFLPWAATIGGDNLETGYKIISSTMEWYDNMNLVVPKWYKGILNFDK